jgi:phosphoglycerol transferase MdoB-like AlkP superfamily enzyme
MYFKGDEIYIHIIFIVFFLLLIPLLIFYTKKNEFVSSTLKHGWFPIILSMFISRYKISNNVYERNYLNLQKSSGGSIRSFHR